MAKHGKANAPNTGNSTEGEELDRKNSAAAGAAGVEREAGIQADRPPRGGSAAGGSNDPMVAIVEAAVNPEFEFLEEFGKEGLEAAETATLSLADKFREIAKEWASCTKEFLDRSYDFAGELRQARSPAAVVEVQIDFVRSAYVRLFDHFLKVSGLYWNLLSQGCNAGETEVAKVKS